jgi:hypothetical protein
MRIDLQAYVLASMPFGSSDASAAIYDFLFSNL